MSMRSKLSANSQSKDKVFWIASFFFLWTSFLVYQQKYYSFNLESVELLYYNLPTDRKYLKITNKSLSSLYFWPITKPALCEKNRHDKQSQEQWHQGHLATISFANCHLATKLCVPETFFFVVKCDDRQLFGQWSKDDRTTII